MKLSLRSAAGTTRRNIGHTNVNAIAWILAGLALGCSQRNEWRDHYIDPPASPRPKPTPTPSPTSVSSEGSDAAAPSVDSSDGSSLGDAGEGSSGALDGGRDAGNLEADAAADGGPDAQAPFAEGAPLVNAALDELALDVFGTYDNRYWFVVSGEQVSKMNERRYGGPIGMYGDIYSPIGGSGGKTYVDHLLVTNPSGATADVGKVQATLVGGSTYRPWTESTLPNIKIDSNEFQDQVRVGGYEHLRFNNGVIGSIFREKFAFDFYRALGYPAPNAGYAWVSSTVWSPEVAVPYIVVEAYKRQFCRDRDDYFGGECPNMWEFAQDITSPEIFGEPDACQYSECDSTVAREMSELVAQTPQAPGFKATTAAYIDWESFHEFQCLSWLFGTPDDYVHGGNNTVIVERPDGKFQFLPYSVDISFNHDWGGGGTQLPGYTALPRGCQADPDCWADTIATCQVLVEAYVAADPVARLDALYADLDAAGMLRQGDETRYEQMRDGIHNRIAGLNDELVYWRDNPNGTYGNHCQYPHVQCGDGCALPQDCYLCGEEPGPRPLPGGQLWLLGDDAGVLGASSTTTSTGEVATSSQATSESSAGSSTASSAPLASSAGDAGTALDAGTTGTTGAVAASSADSASSAESNAAAPSSDSPVTTELGAVADGGGVVPFTDGGGVIDAGYGYSDGQPTSGGGDTTGGNVCQPYINYYYVR